MVSRHGRWSGGWRETCQRSYLVIINPSRSVNFVRETHCMILRETKYAYEGMPTPYKCQKDGKSVPVKSSDCQKDMILAAWPLTLRCSQELSEPQKNKLQYHRCNKAYFSGSLVITTQKWCNANITNTLMKEKLNLMFEPNVANFPAESTRMAKWLYCFAQNEKELVTLKICYSLQDWKIKKDISDLTWLKQHQHNLFWWVANKKYTEFCSREPA